MDRLTAREYEVARLVAQGLSNKQIALRLVVCTSTVKQHISHILAKVKARNRTQLAVMVLLADRA